MFSYLVVDRWTRCFIIQDTVKRCEHWLSSMPINIPGLLVPLQLLLRPHILVPSLIVKGLYLCFSYKPLRACADRMCDDRKICDVWTSRH